MPTTNPRVNVVLGRRVYDAVARLARRDRVSLSGKMKDLVKDALELQEDTALVELAEARRRTFSRQAALSHEQVWKPRHTR